MKTLLAAALGLSLLALPVQAAGLAGISCEHPEMIKVMKDQLGRAKVGHSSLFSHGVYVERIARSETLHASRNKLICGITARLNASGTTNSMRLRVTYEHFQSGKRVVTFDVI